MVPGGSWALSDGTLKEAQRKPYYSDYSPTRLLIHKMCNSHYLDLAITIVIGLNVITMSMEHYQQPQELEDALKICNYIFTLIFVLESVFKLVAFGLRRFFKNKWNQLDLAIVLLSIMGITLEEIEVNASLPINPTIIRIMRVLRIARVLKLLKMAVGMRALLDTVMQALPQVGNLGLLFMLLFFIYAALGVELFGDLICDELHQCEGLGRYATFRNFGMAFLLLFRVSTGDNWNGIMKDTLRDCAQDNGTCYNTVVSPIYFVSFVLTAQFVLVNVVIAVLMKHLEESNKEVKEEELESEREPELQISGNNKSVRLSLPNPLTPPIDRCTSGSSPWRSTEGELMENGRDGPMVDDTSRDSMNIKEPISSLEPQLQLSSEDSPLDNLLSVRKPAMGRTHSLPNDSYILFPQKPFCPWSSAQTQPFALSQSPPNPLSIRRALSGSISSVQPPSEDLSEQQNIPVGFFRPITPQSHSDSECVLRLLPSRRAQETNRTLQRQVTVFGDSQEALCSDGSKTNEGSVNVTSLDLPSPPSASLSSSSPSTFFPHHDQQQEPTLFLIPSQSSILPKTSSPNSVCTHLKDQHCLTSYSSSSSLVSSKAVHPRLQEEALAGHEVSLLTCTGLVNKEDILKNSSTTDSHGNCMRYQESQSSCLRQLKRFHSEDAQSCSMLLARPHLNSLLDDPRRHSVEVYSAVDPSHQNITCSTSSGFLSRPDSLHSVHPNQSSLPSPHRKKRMSPPCISVDPPDGLGPLSGLCPSGLGLPPVLQGKETRLRRRAPSSDSKESFDMAAGEGPGQDAGSLNANSNPKLLTLPSFSLEKTNLEH